MSATLTKTDLAVILFAGAILLAIFWPAMGSEHRLSERSTCAANLRGIVQSMHVYASDNSDVYPMAPASSATAYNASLDLRTGSSSPAAAMRTYYQSDGYANNVYAGPWLLAIRGDVIPKTFICRSDVFTSPVAAQQALQIPYAYLFIIGTIIAAGLGILALHSHILGKDRRAFACASVAIVLLLLCLSVSITATLQTRAKFPGVVAHPPQGPAQIQDDKGDYYLNFQDRSQISYSFAYPWSLSNAGKVTNAPYWTATSDASIPVCSDMAPDLSASATPIDPATALSRNHTPDPFAPAQGHVVAFADVHADFYRTSDVGQNHDNIFAVRRDPTGKDRTEFPIQPGTLPHPLTASAGDFDIVMVPMRDSAGNLR